MSRPMPHPAVALGRRGRCLALAALRSGCAPKPRTAASTRRRSPSFAAASLKESFTSARQDLREQPTPAPRSTFNFGGSSAPGRSRSARGRPPTCSPRPARATWTTVVAGWRRHGPRRTSSRTPCEIAVPPSNPAGRSPRSRPRQARGQGRRCARRRCRAARSPTQVFANARITVKPVSQEVDVKSRADQGRARRGGRRRGLPDRRAGRRRQGEGRRRSPTPRTPSRPTRSPRSPAPSTRRRPRAFVDYVLSDTGRAVLQKAGFQAP